MLLYEELLTIDPKLWSVSGLPLDFDLFWPTLQQAVVVKADNVANYYADSPQVDWALNRDFPVCVSPWPSTFYEWKMPRSLNMNGKALESPVSTTGWHGVLITQYNLDRKHVPSYRGIAAAILYFNELNEAVAQQNEPAFTRLSELGLTGMWAALPQSERDHYEAEADALMGRMVEAGGRWVCSALHWVKLEHYPPLLLHRELYWLNEAGAILPSVQGEGVCYVMCPAVMGKDLMRQLLANNSQGLHVPLLANSFAHCKNVVMVDEVPPPKLSKKQLQRYGIPKVTFKTLRIDPNVTQVRKPHGTGKHEPPPLHICRGHFKDFTQGGGLFGKYHGRYWWPMQVRGNGKRGIVVKDYETVAVQEQAS